MRHYAWTPSGSPFSGWCTGPPPPEGVRGKRAPRSLRRERSPYPASAVERPRVQTAAHRRRPGSHMGPADLRAETPCPFWSAPSGGRTSATRPRGRGVRVSWLSSCCWLGVVGCAHRPRLRLGHFPVCRGKDCALGSRRLVGDGRNARPGVASLIPHRGTRYSIQGTGERSEAPGTGYGPAGEPGQCAIVSPATPYLDRRPPVPKGLKRDFPACAGSPIGSRRLWRGNQ